MVIINDQVERAMPLRQFNKQLGEEGGQTGVLTFLRIASLVVQCPPVAC
ncbi:Uncharacterised protein [Salmonella bongori]|nr:Uncharacterised protein [Salmonella bongori]